MAQHEDLRVLGDGVHVVDRQDLQCTTHQAEEEAEHDGSAGSLFKSCQVKPGIRLLDSSGMTCVDGFSAPTGRETPHSGGSAGVEGCLPQISEFIVADTNTRLSWRTMTNKSVCQSICKANDSGHPKFGSLLSAKL